MKTHIENTAPEFQPVKLVITLESQEEVNELAQVVNFAPLVDSVRSFDLHSLFEDLREFANDLSMKRLTDRFKNTDWMRQEIKDATQL